MSKETNTASGGIGLDGLLFVLFVGLKLTGHITWSWWWVTAPLWLPMAILASLAVVMFGVAGVLHLLDR